MSLKIKIELIFDKSASDVEPILNQIGYTKKGWRSEYDNTLVFLKDDIILEFRYFFEHTRIIQDSSLLTIRCEREMPDLEHWRHLTRYANELIFVLKE